MRHFGVVSGVYLIPLLLAGVGCEEKSKNPMGMTFRDTYGPSQEVIESPKGQPPVLVGKVPLAYMVDFNCVVRVINVDAKTTLAAHDCKAGQIVSIDAADGVRVGDVKVKPGPLDAASRYGIFLEVK